MSVCYFPLMKASGIVSFFPLFPPNTVAWQPLHIPPGMAARRTSRLEAPQQTTIKMTKDVETGRVRFITNMKCPYAQRTWIALEESGTPYDMNEISLYGSGGKPDWFMKLNPKGEVPVLVVEGSPIVGSEETVDFLMIKDIVDSEGVERTTTASRWRALINEKLKPVGKRAVFSGGSRADVASLNAVLNELDSCLGEKAGDGDGPFVDGSMFTAADASAFPFLQRIHGEFGFPAGCAWLETWYASACRRPSVKKTIRKDFWWWW